MGRRNQEIIQYGYDKLEVFGKGADKDELFWSSLLRQALLADLIRKDIEQYGVLKITEQGHKFIKKPWSVEVALNHDYEQPMGDEEEAKPAVLDPELLNLLKELRRKVAKEHNVPPYVIFQDPSLEEMATAYPITIDELAHISGVSKGKAIRYGTQFLKLIEEYVDENDIDRPEDFTMKSVANKSGLKIYIIQSIDRKLPIDDIARSKNVTQAELLHEIETIVLSGTKLDIDYYIRNVMDDDTMEMIYDYFHEAETDSVDEAYAELSHEGITAEEIQLVRLKFLSEMAN
jgi:ATP-dependent DNA helicase RecQ